MKLLTKTNIYTSVATIFLMLVGMVIVYLLVLNKIDSEEDEHLLDNKITVLQLLENGTPIQHFAANVGETIDIKEIPSITISSNRFRDYQNEEDEAGEGEEQFTFRELKFQTAVANKNYEITIAHSLSEGKEIGEYIAVIILIFLALSLTTLLIINRYISRFIWSPFYNTIAQLRSWTLRENKQITMKETNTKEFIELNQTINMFIQKIQEDYVNLKEFTENISHETQTPVAVISAKLEMLMQEDDYSNKQQRLLADAYMATMRLKKLNQALVSLTRIEKGQYTQIDIVNLAGVIERKLIEMNEFIAIKKIVVKKELISIEKAINLEIFGLLINNLLMNAIKYNVDDHGEIFIRLTKNELVFQNTGLTKKIDKENIFERFKPYTTDSDSVGLGLSIMKKIADFLQWEITYEYAYGIHCFRMTWKD